jgi:hypothetical protein
MTEPTKRRGRPTGIPRKGTYGSGVKTKVVRVPEAVGNNIVEVLAAFEQIKVLVDAWDNQVETAKAKSTVGRPSPRYEKAMQLLEELRSYLGK